MLKIRIEGLPQEVKTAAIELRKVYDVLSASKEYPNRNSEYVRVYVDIELKK